MALTAAAQICSGVGKSGSPRLKSKTGTPSALSCLAFAPAARVAEGCTAAAILDRAIMAVLILASRSDGRRAKGWTRRFVALYLILRRQGRGDPEGGASRCAWLISSSAAPQRWEARKPISPGSV